MSEMCELEKAYWDYFIRIRSYRMMNRPMPLSLFLLIDEVQKDIRKLGELYRELTEKDLWQKL